MHACVLNQPKFSSWLIGQRPTLAWKMLCLFRDHPYITRPRPSGSRWTFARWLQVRFTNTLFSPPHASFVVLVVVHGSIPTRQNRKEKGESHGIRPGHWDPKVPTFVVLWQFLRSHPIFSAEKKKKIFAENRLTISLVELGKYTNSKLSLSRVFSRIDRMKGRNLNGWK